MSRSILTTFIGISLSTGLLCAAPVLAQDAGPTPRTEKCTLPPGQAPGKTARTPQGNANEPDLSDCNGVLKAPPTGDQGLVAPAPAVGDMPVIKPGDLPQNTPAPGSTGG